MANYLTVLLASASFIPVIMSAGVIDTFDAKSAPLWSNLDSDGRLVESHDDRNQEGKVADFGGLGEIRALAARLASDDFRRIREGDVVYNVSARCLNHTMVYLEGLMSMKQWALQIFDASSKLPSGILRGKLTSWLGDYAECKAARGQQVHTVLNQSESRTIFEGRYCLAAFPGIGPASTPMGSKLNVAVCLPDSCSATDVKNLINSGLSVLHIKNTSMVSSVRCPGKEPPLDVTAIASITILSIIVAVVAIATAYDVLRKYGSKKVVVSVNCEEAPPISENENQNGPSPSLDTETYTPLVEVKTTKAEETQQPSFPLRLLLAFSVYSNGAKILDCRQREGSLGCVHGIRFISMTWVILCHAYAFSVFTTDNILSFQDFLKRWTFQVIMNGYFSVDAFFVLSGLLVTYLTMGHLERNNGRVNWLIFYLHRYWRLTPPMMLVLMVYVPLFQYWGAGPNWPEHGLEINYCRDDWWKNMLYIENFLYNNGKVCMAWVWYLANDFQFHLISPLIIYPLYRSWIAGTVVIGLLFLGSWITTGILASKYGFLTDAHGAGGLALFMNYGTYFEKIYIKPYCRIQPFLMGVITGYLLHRTNRQLNMKRWQILLGWSIAATLMLSCQYGLYGTWSDTAVMSDHVYHLYEAVSKTAWSAGLAWVIFACVTGNGGFVNTILSWPAWIPLSRLTFCIYLVHPVVFSWYFRGSEKLVHVTDQNIVYFFLGTTVLSSAVAFITSLLFEAPMMGIEKALQSRKQK